MEKLGSSNEEGEYYSIKEDPDSHNLQDYKSIYQWSGRTGQRSQSPIQHISKKMTNLIVLEAALTEKREVISFRLEQLLRAIDKAKDKIILEQNKIPTAEQEKKLIEENIKTFKELNKLRHKERIILKEELKDIDIQIKELEKLPKRKRKEKKCSEVNKAEEENDAPSIKLFQLEPSVQIINEWDPNSEMNSPASSEDIAVTECARDNSGIETFGPHRSNK